RGSWARSACGRARHALTLRPPGASRMSRLHRQPGSRKARPEFPEYRARQGTGGWTGDTRAEVRAGAPVPFAIDARVVDVRSAVVAITSGDGGWVTRSVLVGLRRGGWSWPALRSVGARSACWRPC